MLEMILTLWGPLYLAIGLMTLLILIRSWVSIHGSYDGIEEGMNQIVLLSLIGWPYVLLVWVKSWPLFSWKFWLRKGKIRAIHLPAYWWTK